MNGGLVSDNMEVWRVALEGCIPGELSDGVEVKVKVLQKSLGGGFDNFSWNATFLCNL